MSEKKDFDFNLLLKRVTLPEQELTINGAEFQHLMGLVAQAMDDNTLAVFKGGEQDGSYCLLPTAQGIVDVYSFLNRHLLRKFYEEGKTLSAEEAQAELQKRAEHAKANPLQVVEEGSN